MNNISILIYHFLIIFIFLFSQGNNYVEHNAYSNMEEENLNICAGYDNGDIKFFDLRTMRLEHEVRLIIIIINHVNIK